MEPIHPSKLNISDVVWEVSQYGSIEIVITTKPEHKDNKWVWTARAYGGEPIEYLVTDGLEHYGPRVYQRPAVPPLKYLNGEVVTQ